MPLRAYESKRFSAATKTTIDRANQILEEYAAMDYDLTLRQLYYQFVARGLIANKQTEYKKLGSVVNDARMAGLIDWSHIVDRTRNLRSLAHWGSPASIVRSAAAGFRRDLWADQDWYVEAWIEKDALVGVIEGVCEDDDVPFFSCRGYTSQSEMWGASRRLLAQIDAGKRVAILHLGDHDPSGIDMSRDIKARLLKFLVVDHYREGAGTVDESLEFMADRFAVERLALNYDQVEEYDPPPNPAKLTDSRASGYVARHGYESWELDALPPDVLSGLIADAIDDRRDRDVWDESVARQERERELLTSCSDRWGDVVAMLDGH